MATGFYDRRPSEQDIIEFFDERAAIYEFDGGLSRSESEHRAYHDLRRWYGTKFAVPQSITKLVRKWSNGVRHDRQTQGIRLGKSNRKL